MIKEIQPNDHVMDPSLNVFFTHNDLKKGKKLPIYFSSKDPSTSPHILSREEVNSIPFSSSQLTHLIDFFAFSEDSPQAKAMEYTLTQCELAPLKGEARFCATSLESMLDSTIDIFKSKIGMKVLSTTHLVKPSLDLQNYTIIEEPTEIFAEKMIGCHTMPYPYAVYYCHGQEKKNVRLFEILLEGENGGNVKAIGACHMDTSQWDHNHVSFKVLKMKPGSSPVCHFFPEDNLVWVLL
ncbi:hypothetical protein ACFE04_022949 [Oxalis oulophora]